MELRQIQFSSVRALADAFMRLQLDLSVETCLAEPESLTLRYRRRRPAPKGPHGPGG